MLQFNFHIALILQAQPLAAKGPGESGLFQKWDMSRQIRSSGASSTIMAQVWHTYGTRMAHVWLTYGTCTCHAWHKYGTSNREMEERVARCRARPTALLPSLCDRHLLAARVGAPSQHVGWRGVARRHSLGSEMWRRISRSRADLGRGAEGRGAKGPRADVPRGLLVSLQLCFTMIQEPWGFSIP